MPLQRSELMKVFRFDSANLKGLMTDEVEKLTQAVSDKANLALEARIAYNKAHDHCNLTKERDVAAHDDLRCAAKNLISALSGSEF